MAEQSYPDAPDRGKQAWLSGLALMGLAIVAGVLLKDAGLFSLVPPGGSQPDAIGRELWLALSVFTAWAALILLIPAYIFVWRRNLTPASWVIWRSFWAVSFAAYLLHLAIAMFGFFGGDFASMTNSTRVSAFWPGMILVPWWALDLWLADRAETRAIRGQRIALHLGTFVLFFGGSAITGELAIAKLLGVAFLATTLIGAGLWLRGRRT